MMRRIRHALLVSLIPGALIAATVSGAVGTTAAQAYGTVHVYQLTYSLNCDNKSSPMCGPNAFGLGGAWGWIEPDSDGTADGQATFCAHGQAAFHQDVNGVSWSFTSASDLSPAQFPVGTDPNGNYIVSDPSSAIGFIAFPATPGHYSQSFGPGIQTQATVTLMH